MKLFRLILLILIFSLVSVSLFSTLFYSWKGWALGFVAFFIVFISGWFKRDKKLGSASASKIKNGLFGILGVIVFLSLVTLFASARETGVYASNGDPIFAAREHYFLNNHGRKTEVSRVRFLAVGTSFNVGWHSMVLLAALYFLTTPKKISKLEMGVL